MAFSHLIQMVRISGQASMEDSCWSSKPYTIAWLADGKSCIRQSKDISQALCPGEERIDESIIMLSSRDRTSLFQDVQGTNDVPR